MRLIALPGDGIGPENRAVMLMILRAVSQHFGLDLHMVEEAVGHESLHRHGTNVRPDMLDAVRNADRLIRGPAAAFEIAGEIDQQAPAARRRAA